MKRADLEKHLREHSAEFQIAADFSRRGIVDFSVARNAGGFAIGRIPPDGMFAAFAKEIPSPW